VQCGSTFLLLKKVKWSCYRPGVAQRVGRGIALLFHDRDTRRGWVVNSTPRPHFTPGKESVPIVQEAGWAPGSVWRGGKSHPHRDSISNRPARSSITILTELPGPQISFIIPTKTLHRLHINLQKLLVQVMKHYNHYLQFVLTLANCTPWWR